MIIGVLIALIGLVWLLSPSIPWLGKLPGDIMIERESFRFYFPLATCVLLSLVLTGHVVGSALFTVTVMDEAAYVCDACGEEIVIPLDLSEGSTQKYVEDCPVCCRPNMIHVEIGEDGKASVWAEAE